MRAFKFGIMFALGFMATILVVGYVYKWVSICP
jgi:hypothetical protein